MKSGPRTFCTVRGCGKSWPYHSGRDDGVRYICKTCFKAAPLHLRDRVKRIRRAINGENRKISSDPVRLERLIAVHQKVFETIVSRVSRTEVSGAPPELADLGLL